MQAHSQLSSYDEEEEVLKTDVVDLPLQVPAAEIQVAPGLEEIKEEPAEEEERHSAKLISRKRSQLSRTLPLQQFLPGSDSDAAPKKNLSKTQKLLMTDKRQYDEPFRVSQKSVHQTKSSKPSSSRPSELNEVRIDGDQEEVEKRREFAERLERELASQYIDKELSDMLDSSLLTKRKQSPEKEEPAAAPAVEVPA